jgi:Holliday junction resolvasome RuvABC endonuclease subunit
MLGPDATPVLLAIDAGVRETGWAIFLSGRLVTSGVIGAPNRRRVDIRARVSYIVRCLDDLAAKWQPGAVVYSQPSGLHWPVPALELLDAALAVWSRRHGLGLCGYSAQEVRSAIAGHPNASRDQLGYAIMVQLGLIGQDRTTHEWEAIAVGAYHLHRSQ